VITIGASGTHVVYEGSKTTARHPDWLPPRSRGALEPARVGRLLRVVDDDLGLVLHRAVEGAKVGLSSTGRDRVVLDAIELDLAIDRASFENWIADDLAAIDRVLDDVLARAGAAESAIDRVFATGAVAWGLAARARQVFGDARGQVVGG
jgi:hypothetical chaperone protein